MTFFFLCLRLWPPFPASPALLFPFAFRCQQQSEKKSNQMKNVSTAASPLVLLVLFAHHAAHPSVTAPFRTFFLYLPLRALTVSQAHIGSERSTSSAIASCPQNCPIGSRVVALLIPCMQCIRSPVHLKNPRECLHLLRGILTEISSFLPFYVLHCFSFHFCFYFSLCLPHITSPLLAVEGRPPRRTTPRRRTLPPRGNCGAARLCLLCL